MTSAPLIAKNLDDQEISVKSGSIMLHWSRTIPLMPLDLRSNESFPISDFVRNASEHTARIRLTRRAGILTQHVRPSLSFMPFEEHESLIAAIDFMDTHRATS